MDDAVISRSPDDVGRPLPAIALTGWRTRVTVPRPGVTFPVLAIALGGFMLWTESRTGWTSTTDAFIVATIPRWVVFAALVVVGFVVLVRRIRDPRPSWYRWWSLLDMREEHVGVRLMSNRARADHPGVLARRGEDVEVHAELVTRNLSGGRSYRYRVRTPDGEITFTADGWIEKLSMAALDAEASRWGFTVSAHGQAQRIRRR